MPVLLAPILLAAIAALVIFVVVVLYFLVLGPIVEWLVNPGGGFFHKIVFWPVRKATRKVEHYARQQVGAMSRFVASNAYPVALILQNTTILVQRTAGTLGDSAEATYNALYTLRHVTVPRLIAAALVPVNSTLTAHTTRLNTIEDRERQVSNRIASMLRALPWAVGGDYVPNFDRWLDSYTQLWRYVYGQLRTRVNDLYERRVPALEKGFATWDDYFNRLRRDTLPDILGRLKAIEGFLGGLATDPTTWIFGLIGAALVPALTPPAIRAGFGSLFCRNTLRAAREICAADPRNFDDLLAFLIAGAILLNFREYVKLMQSVTGETATGIKDLLQVV